MNILEMGITGVAEATVEYGPLRLAVAAWAQIDPADVTAELVSGYEAEGQPCL